MDLYPFVRPFVMLLKPETGHTLAIKALKMGLIPPQPKVDDPVLKTRVLGLEFPNPLGLAAGFDKNAEAADAMHQQGFGFVEVGTVTPKAQSGNPKPRLFRLVEDRAVINRMGFNNAGMEAMAERLAVRKGKGIVGVNLGKNKDTEKAVDDYVLCARRLAQYADYLAINVSSPNTPGLRSLQSKEPLIEIIGGVRNVLKQLEQDGQRRPPLMLKIAPDLEPEDLKDIADVIMGEGLDVAEGETGVDALIVTSTTWSREGLVNWQKNEQGGMSGKPLFEASTRVLSQMYELTDGKMPLVGVGGIETGEDAYKKIRAGASLVQVYSAMVYEGPALGARIAKELAVCLKADGFSSVAEAVGADHKVSE